MSSRPSHIRVARLAPLVGRDNSTCWRRAKAGIYGRLTRDAEGRLQVELSEVERAEGRVFDDTAVARAAATASKNPTQEARKAEHARSIWPGPMEIKTGKVAFFTPQEAADFALDCIEQRDMQWRIAIANASHRTHRS